MRAKFKLMVVAWCGVGMFWAGTASAQDNSAYSPLRPNAATMLTTGEFKESPLKLPFAQSDVRAVSSKRGNNINFEHTLDVPYDEVLAFFDDPKNRKDGVEIVNPRVFPSAAGVKLRVKGLQDKKDGSREMRMAHESLSRDFVLTIRSAGPNQTKVMFKNIVYTTVASGLMPARTGFFPAFSDMLIPFDFN